MTAIAGAAPLESCRVIPGQTAGFAWRLHVHETLPSTQTYCVDRAEDGEPEGLAVLARTQSAGQGRQGRAWVASAGNLALSVLLRPDCTAAQMPQWSLLAGLATIEALCLYTEPTRLQLKWPNDVLQDGAKLAGILVQGALRPDARCDWLVIGIGVNLASAPLLPDRPTAFLRDADPPAPEQLAAILLECLDRWRARFVRNGFAAVREAWLAYAHPIGTRLQTGTINAPFAGLADDGALLLHGPNGILRIESGEVELAVRRSAGR